MDPREFLRRYRYDERLVNGGYYASTPLEAKPGETVGVVLLNLGGPRNPEEVEPFLYNLFMDPAIIDIPVKGVMRHWLCRFVARRRSQYVREEYQQIGGRSPINLLTAEQARNLEEYLNRSFEATTGVRFHVYVAMRYGPPTSEDAARQMQQDGVDKVVLLPLYPHFSKTTTGSSLQYWWVLEQAGEIPAWPTTHPFEYAAHPQYIQAISARIDEGLARFPEEVRRTVHFVFSAHGTPLKEMKERRDPYCCLVHATVDRIMKLRGADYPYHVAFQSKVGPAEWLTPSTPDKLKELGEAGTSAVLVIPVAFVSDHVETAFELDIEVRKEAHEHGITHFEVMPGLNSHPLFIEALADVTRSQLLFSGPGGRSHKIQEQPAASHDGPRPCYKPSERATTCHQCPRITEAFRWDG